MTTPSSSSSAPASAKASTSANASADNGANKSTRRKASAKAIEILPPLPDADEWTCTSDDITLPPALEFEPVTLRGGVNSVTPMKQRVFIRVLAETGRICLAAKATGNTPGSFYYLRNHAAGESFGAAWDRARDFGTGRVLDILLDHAINGVPEYIYKDGVLVAERRRFNHHLMMWLVAHNMPETFGVHGGLMHSGSGGAAGAARMKRLKAEWHAEWEAEWTATNPLAATSEETRAAILKKLKEQWRAEWEEEQRTQPAASAQEACQAVMKNMTALGKRLWFQKYVPWMDHPEKRAACEILYGPQDWDAIRLAAAEEAEEAEARTFRPESHAGTG